MLEQKVVLDGVKRKQGVLFVLGLEQGGKRELGDVGARERAEGRKQASKEATEEARRVIVMAVCLVACWVVGHQ